MKEEQMRVRIPAVLAAILLIAPAALAQQQTGSISGKVTDNSGAVLPGVTVTVASPVLLQPQVATTSQTGTYNFARLPIGTYDLTFELAGFRTVVRKGVQIEIGFNAQINQQLDISAVEETVTVSGESPIVDTKSTTEKTSFDLESMQNIPSSRDPWDLLNRVPAIATDRVNVGGSQSGQQSGYISRGSSSGNNKWSVDGVDITDMSATGASPIYYDFDMFQEMQITTGGADASQQTGGVGINIVTRGGTDTFRGSGRLYATDQKFEDDNVDDELRAQGAVSGNPIQNIQDYGVEAGGPIMRGKLWFWGSYGKQNVKVGVLGFYKDEPGCRPTPPTDTEGLRNCLSTDLTTLNNYNYKVNWAPFQNNQFAWQNTFAEKIRNARDASDTRPIETTYRQHGVSSDYGAWGWKSGPAGVWKASDKHIFSDRWLMEFQWAHVGNNFTLDFHEPSLKDVQRAREITTGAYSRSYQASDFVRPTNSVDLTTTYFVPAFAGGDHSIKSGFRWREAPVLSASHVGGFAEARFENGVATEATLYRDSLTEYDLQTYAWYVQDNITVNRFNVQLGLRYDRQRDAALPSAVGANPIVPEWLPAISFNGADTGIVWNTWSPRLGLTYDLRGDGRTVAKTSYSVYYGQLGKGGLAGNLNPVSSANIRFPWNDLNGDRTVQRDELDESTILSFGGNYDPDNPTALESSGTVDPNIKDDRTREFIIGIDHELARGIAVGASYIWRKYDRFSWDDTIGFSSADYEQITYTPPASSCPDGARCPTVTYYQPLIDEPAAYVSTNVPDRWRDYNGVELSLTKRYSNNWRADMSFAYNNAIDHWGSPDSYEDPSNLETANGYQYAPQSGGSGIDNIFTNSKWLVKFAGMYSVPYGHVNVAASLDAHQGYPFPVVVRTPSRAHRAGRVDVRLDPLGSVRLPNLYIMNLRVDRPIPLHGGARLIPSVDIFNLTNANTILSRRRTQNADNANDVSSIVSPRVIRFGVRIQW
ncbi:MAG TPA: TonB-dependent receptor [Vicinamibacterales bacterium]|nr:TonB-dependent receptor [Vicinamibacterales bacterium]